jgi:arginyl-tRNA synthetase
MADPIAVLSARLQPVFDALEPGADPVVRPSDRADAQCNGALPLAKRLGRNPREVAAEVVAAARLDDICSTVEVAGPGFVNLTFSQSFLAGQLAEVAADERLGVPVAAAPDVVVVDYSAPNVAKEMHVGHLRTTIIGDALCRVLHHLGHTVIRENHVGDWGTPFGMLIEHLLDLGEDEAAHELSLGDLDAFYRQARTKFDADDEFKERSRQRVVLLQSGDAETLRLWRLLVDESVAYFDQVYAKLGVLLTDADLMGESAYNPLLPGVVADLDAAGLLVESEGARCVFPPGSRVGRASRSRSSCRRPTAGSGTRPPTWPASGTGWTGWAPPAPCTWWAPPRPSTSPWSSPWPSWPAGSPRTTASSTSRSATSSAPTARCSRPARAGP